MPISYNDVVHRISSLLHNMMLERVQGQDPVPPSREHLKEYYYYVFTDEDRKKYNQKYKRLTKLIETPSRDWTKSQMVNAWMKEMWLEGSSRWNHIGTPSTCLPGASVPPFLEQWHEPTLYDKLQAKRSGENPRCHICGEYGENCGCTKKGQVHNNPHLTCYNCGKYVRTSVDVKGHGQCPNCDKILQVRENPSCRCCDEDGEIICDNDDKERRE